MAGADYVQTPEMTNIWRNREQLFVIVDESPTPRWPHSASWRANSAFSFMSVRWRSRSRRRRPPIFVVDPKGDIAARYDKIHMFDVDLAGGESYRESRNYRPGEPPSRPICRGAGSG